MMRSKRLRSISFFLVFVLCLPAGSVLWAGSLGDAAPELQVNTWIRGGPVKLKTGPANRIYVLEFWQTECPHCLDSLPYLSVLQEQYRKDGVVFIGITVEDPGTVRTFLAENPDSITYAVATDAEEKTYELFMDSFGVSGVPHAFIIGRQGRILWEGHPMDNLEEVLSRIVAGRYDLKGARDLSMARKLLTAYVYLSIETDEVDIAGQVGKRVYGYGQHNAPLMVKLARFIISNEKNRQPDYDLALLAARRACAITAEKDPAALEAYAAVLFRRGAEEEARTYMKKAKRLNNVEKAKAQE